MQNKDKEGYQATVLAGQSDETSARIMKQLDGQDGRPFGGRCCAWLDTVARSSAPYRIASVADQPQRDLRTNALLGLGHYQQLQAQAAPALHGIQRSEA